LSRPPRGPPQSPPFPTRRSSDLRPRAAEFLAAQGAQLDLESAAGLGRIDVVKSYFDCDDKLDARATKQQLQKAFLWACMYGREEDRKSTRLNSSHLGISYAVFCL